MSVRMSARMIVEVTVTELSSNENRCLSLDANSNKLLWKQQLGNLLPVMMYAKNLEEHDDFNYCVPMYEKWQRK